MRKALKILGYTLLSIFLLVIILIVTASFFQSKIAKLALEEVSEIIKAPVEVEEVSFSLIKRFPLASIQFSGVRLGAEIDSTGNTPAKDDIANIGDVLVSVETMPLLDNEFEIKKVEISDVKLRYHVDSLGLANIAFLIPPADSSAVEEPVDSTSSALPKIDLEKFYLKNIQLFYKDDTANIAASLKIPELTASGKIFNSHYLGDIKGSMSLRDVNVAGTNAHKLEEAALDFKMNYQQDTLYIQSFDFKSEGAHLNLNGKASLLKDIFTDVQFKSNGIDLEKLIKYAPEKELKKFGVKKVKGLLTLSGTVKGLVGDSILPHLKAHIAFKNGYAKTRDYPEVKSLYFSGDVTNGSKRNNETTSAVFNTFHLATARSFVKLAFNVSNIDKPKYRVKTKARITLEEFKKFVPDTLIKSLSGKVIASISTRGQLKDSVDDAFINRALYNTSLKAQFEGINVEMDSLDVKNFNGKMAYSPGRFSVNDVNVSVPTFNAKLLHASIYTRLDSLSISDQKRLEVLLDSFRVETPQANLWGDGRVKNIEHPDFNLNANAEVFLDSLKPFVPDTLVKTLSGKCFAKVKTYGNVNLDSIADQAMDIVFKQSRIHFEAQNISAQLPNDPSLNVKKLNAKVRMVPDTITVNKVTGSAAGVDFNFDSTRVINVYNSVLQNRKETMFVRGVWKVGDIDHTVFNPLLAMLAAGANSTETNNTSTTSADSTAVEEPTNFKMDIKGKFGVKSFTYDEPFIDKMAEFLQWPDSDVVFYKSMLRDQILVENISGKFSITDSVYLVDQFKFDAFNGSSNNSFKIKMLTGGKQEIYSRNTVTNMDMQKLLYDCSNFAMDSVITSENISGKLTTTFNTMIEMNDTTEFDMKNLRVRGEMKLEDGGIYNYEPAMAMEIAPGTKDMDNIKFKTLESKLFIFKSLLYVPSTHIISSEKDISFFGMYKLDPNVKGDDYHFRVFLRLGQLFAAKSKEKRKQALASEDVSEEDKKRRTTQFIYRVDKTGEETMNVVVFRKEIKAGERLKTKILTQDKILGFRFKYNLSYETGVK